MTLFHPGRQAVSLHPLSLSWVLVLTVGHGEQGLRHGEMKCSKQAPCPELLAHCSLFLSAASPLWFCALPFPAFRLLSHHALPGPTCNSRGHLGRISHDRNQVSKTHLGVCACRCLPPEVRAPSSGLRGRHPPLSHLAKPLQQHLLSRSSELEPAELSSSDDSIEGL